MAAAVSTGEVVSFRLRAHHLAQRADVTGMLEAAGRCAIQNSPPGSALLALNARVRDVTADRVADAVAEDKSLLQTWSMRGAPYLFPTVDAPTFTTGVLPPTEEGMRHLVRGVVQAIDELGIGLTEAVELCAADLPEVLSGRRLAIDELGRELADRIAGRLTPSRLSAWQAAGPYAAGQSLGEGVVHFCVRILTLQRIVCFAPRAGNRAPFVLVEEWLGHPIPDVDPATARAELLRRYLRCYGPSTRAGFAAWVGVNAGDAGGWWDLVEDELTPVQFGGTAWMLTEDLDALRSARPAEGVRLLPPHDPYTRLRDRGTIVAPEHHRKLWRAAGGPGAVLVGGRVAGTWRPRRRGPHLTVAVTTFDALGAGEVQLLRDEAGQVARVQGVSSHDVTLDSS